MLSCPYLGHRMSRDGLQPTAEKVRAITKSPCPTNLFELRAFLGLVNFYGKFMQNLSTLLTSYSAKEFHGNGRQPSSKHSRG